MEFTQRYLSDVQEIAQKINKAAIVKVVDLVASVRERGGRMFIIGVGGGAGHASHAVNDFRKIVGIEAYAPTDNVSELTARINDDGWDSCYAEWLKISHLNKQDMVFVFSVGGGNLEYGLSTNIVEAVKLAKSVGATVAGIVGRDGGETAKMADVSVIVPNVNAETTTALTESFQAVIWHLIVSHPRLYSSSMKWESLTKK